MPLPPTVIKVKKDRVEYISGVDRVKYTMVELERAAYRDFAKLCRRRMLDKVRRFPGLRKGKRPPNAFQYWIRKRECNLQLGIKHDTWYGVEQEMGTEGQPKRAVLRDTTFENAGELRTIAGMYLKRIEDEDKVLEVIDEEEVIGDEPEH